METATDRALGTARRQRALLARLGLLATALLAWRAASVLWEGGTTPTDGYATGLMIGTTAYGFVLLLWAALQHRWLHLAQWIIPPALGLISLCYLQNHLAAQLEHGPVTTDVQIYTDYAARWLLEGNNPYAADLLDSYRVHRMPFTFSTPLADGDLTGRVAYPALHLLLFVPFLWLGIGTQWVYLLSLLVTLALLYARAPAEWRPLVLVPFFLDSRFLLYTFGGVSDCVWAMLLCLMVLHWRHRALRAIWFGLAVSFKHQPWVLAPFLLLRLWHEGPQNRRERLRELAWFFGISAAVFTALNLPFFVWSPGDWLAGVFEPVRAPMITFGQGLSALSMSGIVPMPKWLFSVILATVLGAGLVLTGAYYRRMRLAIWVVPGLALWFSHRSLSSYWYFFLFPLVADWLRSGRQGAGESASPTGSRIPLFASAGALGAVAVLALVTVWTRATPLDVAVQWPLYVSEGQVTGMNVSVHNRTDRPISPRIAVQASALQPYFWTMERGPGTLAPDERGLYRIRAGANFERFSVRRGARVVVSSAADLSVRAAALVPRDVSDAYRDVIPNGRFRFWEAREQRPAFWGVVAEPPLGGRVLPGSPAGEGAPASGVILELDGATAAADETCRLLLDTYVVLPHDPIEVTVRVPESANRLPDWDLLYGLRLVVDRQELWVLFGDEERRGSVAGHARYAMIEAPRDAWSTHSIDLRQLAREAGIPLVPVYGRRSGSMTIDYPAVLANVQLMLAAQAPRREVSAQFGPVVSSTLRPDAAALFAEGQTMPELIYVWRGDLAFSYGNYEKAQQHYQHASRLQPKAPLPQLRLADAALWAGRWEEALRAYQAALDLDVKQPLAYKGAGWCHYNLGRYVEAIVAWRGALRLFELRGPTADPSHVADALKGISMAELRRGECTAGLEALERARQLQPDLTVDAELLKACR